MPTVDVRDKSGEVTGQIDLSPAVFDVPFSPALVHQVIVSQLANKRQGTVRTKTRADVSGGGIKPFKQKGTGRARQGSIRTPVYKGGGTAFGPKPRCWRQRLSKRMRRTAVRQILSDKVRESRLIVLDELNQERPRTREIRDLLRALGVSRRVLIVVDGEKPQVVRSASNIPSVAVERAERICALDAIRADYIVITRAATRRLEEMYQS